MLNQERVTRYVGPNWLDEYEPAEILAYARLTGPQRRRLKHKRRAHSHDLVQRCNRCKPGYRPDPEKIGKWERI